MKRNDAEACVRGGFFVDYGKDTTQIKWVAIKKCGCFTCGLWYKYLMRKVRRSKQPTGADLCEGESDADLGGG